MQASPRLTPREQYEVLREHLLPMLPGAALASDPIARDYEGPVTREASNSLLLSPDPELRICFRLVRDAYPFDDGDYKLVKHFVKAIHEKLVAVEFPFFRYLLDRCAHDAVASVVRHKAVDDDILPTILSLFHKWSSETYEGQRISVAIGIDPKPEPSRISNLHLKEIVNDDFTKVLSNGLDTLLVLSPSGHVVEHLAVEQIASSVRSADEWKAPHRYQAMASWSKGDRVALTLNRHGEILIFSKSQLRFAYRRGRWSHFAHDAMIARMTTDTLTKGLMRSVYATCLDVSFGRSGGCFAVAKSKNKQKASDYIAPSDLIASATTKKTRLLSHSVGRPFDQLPREIRAEIAGLDGAVVMDENGVVVAAGAIVRVPGGSTGGGRRAAAVALSRLGLSIKVSSDGGITAFTDQGPTQRPEVAFEVSG
jgi:hypothetical protein